MLLKVGDDLSTDGIMPAGARVLPFRSNIPKIAEFCFEGVDDSHVTRAKEVDAHIVVAGENYGQGSSREHAALAPRYLGLNAVISKSFARIHAQNLVNFGVLALTDPSDYDDVEPGDVLRFADLREGLRAGHDFSVENTTRGSTYAVRHAMSSRQVDAMLAGGLLNWMKERLANDH